MALLTGLLAFAKQQMTERENYIIKATSKYHQRNISR
jgi:hypothetical protein